MAVQVGGSTAAIGNLIVLVQQLPLLFNNNKNAMGLRNALNLLRHQLEDAKVRVRAPAAVMILEHCVDSKFRCLSLRSRRSAAGQLSANTTVQSSE